MRKFIKDLFEKEWDLDDKVLCMFVVGLAGILAGIIFSPIKHGFYVASNNGCNNGNNNSGSKYFDQLSDDEDEEDDEE